VEQLTSECARREARGAYGRRKRSRERRTLAMTTTNPGIHFYLPMKPPTGSSRFEISPGPASQYTLLPIADISVWMISPQAPYRNSRSVLRGNPESTQKTRTIRDALLRFHPNKFEGRVMSRASEADRARVQKGIGIVVRTLNKLTGPPGDQ